MALDGEREMNYGLPARVAAVKAAARSLRYAVRRAKLRREREDRAAPVGMTKQEKANPREKPQGVGTRPAARTGKRSPSTVAHMVRWGNGRGWSSFLGRFPSPDGVLGIAIQLKLGVRLC